MKLKIIISFCLIYVLLFNQVIAGVLFSEIFPNTNDDKNLEYIELFNSGSIDLSLSGFILKDKSGKEHIFGSGNILLAGERKKYFRNDTKILLNNSNEELYLYDNNSNLLDSYFYESTIKGEKIIIKGLDGIIESNSGIGIIESNTGIIENTGGIINSGTGIIKNDNGLIENGSGIIESNTGIIENNSGIIETNTGIIEEDIGEINSFELIFSFQNPSYLLNKDKILKEYICDSAKDECKINLDLRNSFTGGYDESDYECEIDFGFDGWLNGEEKKCNPNTIVFPKGEYDLKFKIIEKNNYGNVFIGGFLLKNEVKERIIEVEKIVTNTKTIYVDRIIYKDNIYEYSNENIEENNLIEDINIETPKIIIQSGLDENNFCKKEECKINLKYEIKNELEKCLWKFNGGIFSEGTEQKCNPGYVDYGLGNFEIKLKVFQKDFENNFKEMVLNFKNEKYIIIDNDNDKSSLIYNGKNNKINDENNKIENNKIENNKIENNQVENSKTDIENNENINSDSNIKNIQIYKIMPNPKGSDILEYVEIINNSVEKINLKGCILDDKGEGGSKKYIFENNDFIKPGKIKKFYKEQTNINFNNNADEVNLFCDNILLDSLKWNFDIKSGYYLNHERLEITSGNAKVLRVIDGDTIEVQFLDSLRKEKLRFIGVDTPETKNPNKLVEYFGVEAYEFTKENLLGKKVLIEIDKNNFRDKYSRLLGYIFLNGENFNKKLIEKGYAKAYLKYDFKYKLDFENTEKKAKKEKIGIWSQNIDNIIKTKTVENIKGSLETDKLDEKKDIKNFQKSDFFLGKKIKNSSGFIFDKSDIKGINKYSDEIVIDKNTINPVIKLQGKIGKNKILKGNTLTCIDSCSINFDGGDSNGNIDRYIWDFGNGKTYEGKNPGYIKFEYFGKYKVDLKVLSSNGEEKVNSFYIEYIASLKKMKTKEEKITFLDSDSKINNSFSGIVEKNIKLNNNGSLLILDQKLNIGSNKIIEILLYLLIFVFSLNLIVMVLKKEKLL